MNRHLSLEYIKLLSKIISINGIQTFNNEIVLTIDFKQIIPITRFLKDHSNCQYKALTAIAGVDYLENKIRFEVNYEVLSLKFNSRIRIKTYANEITPIKSIGENRQRL
jgi:NADH dehydrogenase (ubiquinone) Fe-S protein 3